MTLRGERGESASGNRAIEHCAYCHERASMREGCTSDTITFPDGTIEEAIAYGEEETLISITGTCPNCGVKPGGYHHPFCSVEECPRCGYRLMQCGCLDTDCLSRQRPR